MGNIWQIRHDGAPGGSGALQSWHGLSRVFADPVIAHQFRQDGVDTMILQQQLEEMEAEVFRAIYPTIKTPQVIPIDASGDPGAETYAFGNQDGVAKWGLLADDARGNDAPSQEITRTKDVFRYYSFAHAFSYTINDLRRAALASRNGAALALEVERALLARRTAEELQEKIIANGYSGTDLQPLLNYSGVGSEDVASWEDMTDGETLLAAIVGTFMKRISALGGAEELYPNRWVLPPSAYFHAAGLPMSVAGATLVTDRSVLDVATNQLRRIVPDFEFQYWRYCTLAEPGGSRHRSILYRYSTDVLRAKISVPFEMLPVQPEGFGFNVPCHFRIAGTVIHRPVGVYYVDIAPKTP